MTEEEINQLSAGNETNALIAEMIFSWTRLTDSEWELFKTVEAQMRGILTAQDDRFVVCWMRSPEGWIWPPRQYSTDIAESWRIVEKLCVAGWHCEITSEVIDGYEVRFDRLSRVEYTQATAESAPLAICRAALKTLNPIKTVRRKER